MFSVVVMSRIRRGVVSLALSVAWADSMAADQLEEVVVAAPRGDTLGLAIEASTASRLEVAAIDLPFSVSRIDQRNMQAKSQTTIADAANGTTGLSGYARAGAAGVYSWRGFTENAIATLYDGIRVQGSTVTTRQYDTFAFERIEVARGPGSALHGEGALSGAINYVRKQPQRVSGVNAELLAAVGSYDSARVGLGVNAELSESVHARADVVRQQFGSQVRGNETVLTHGVGSVLWDLSKDVSMLFQVDHLDVDVEDAYWGTPVIGDRVAFELRKVNYNNATNNRYDDQVTWLRWQTQWRLNDAVKVSNQMYHYDAGRDWRNIGRFLWNSGSASVGRTFWEDLAYQHELFGDRLELQVNGTLAGMRNRFLLGADVSRTDFESPRNYSAPFGLQQQVDRLAPPAVDFFAFGRERVRARETEVKQWAVFAENRLEFGERFAVQAALRRDQLDVDFRRLDVTPAQFYSADYGPTSWNVGATWRPFAQATLYAQYGSSATPADSLLVIADSRTAGFDLTEGKGLEIGFKQIVAGGALEWTVAVYQLEQQNIPSSDPDNPASTRLIGEQSSQGVEVALAWRPLESLLVEANVAALAAEYDTFREGGIDRAGNRPPNVPERVANLDIDYALTPHWSAGASLRYVGDVTANTSNSILFPSYTLADLRLRFALNAASDVSLFVNNILDKEYAAWATGAGGQAVMANIGAPRTASAQLRVKF